MRVLEKLTSALNQKDENPNIELAKEIVLSNDTHSVKELIKNLNNKNRKIQNDCIKTLYEIGERKPKLISEYFNEFIGLLESKNPRMIWGSICALSAIAQEKPKEIHRALPEILSAVDKTQSVIARDHTVYILTKLAAFEKYKEDALQLLLEIIMRAPINQLAMYAEYASTVVDNKHKSIFCKALICRLEDLQQESKIKRIEKVLRKLEK